MYKNSSAPSINAALWHYLGTYNLDFRRDNNSTPGVLIEEIRYLKKPCIPVAFLIHENKQKDTQEKLFKFISEKFSALKSIAFYLLLIGKWA